MKNKSVHIDLQSTVSHLLRTVESEVPVHFAGGEERLFSVFLSVIGFSSFQDFLRDVELFLREEIDFSVVSYDNVSDLKLNTLASKFGKRYRLVSIVEIAKNNELTEFQMMGWKATRIILVSVLKPELKLLPFEEAQRLVLTLHDFIDSYSIIQGVNPKSVIDEIQFWDIFSEYRFTLELDDVAPKLLPTDEFIVWHHQTVSCKKCGEVMEKNKLIVRSSDWEKFFEDHRTSIEVAEGQLHNLVAVLYQMEQKQFFCKNKRKGCWKIWQMTLIDCNNEPFSRELRKISSIINKHSADKEKQTYQFAKDLVGSLC